MIGPCAWTSSELWVMLSRCSSVHLRILFFGFCRSDWLCWKLAFNTAGLPLLFWGMCNLLRCALVNAVPGTAASLPVPLSSNMKAPRQLCWASRLRQTTTWWVFTQGRAAHVGRPCSAVGVLLYRINRSLPHGTDSSARHAAAPAFSPALEDPLPPPPSSAGSRSA